MEGQKGPDEEGNDVSLSHGESIAEGEDESGKSSTGPVEQIDWSSVAPDDFSVFGKEGGDGITNKSTILSDLDRALGFDTPPAVRAISRLRQLCGRVGVPCTALGSISRGVIPAPRNLLPSAVLPVA